MAGNPDTQFAELWEAAVARYQQSSEQTLPPEFKLPNINDFESFRQEVEDSQFKFEQYRNRRASLWRSLRNILGPVELLGNAVAGASSVVMPAGPTIMCAASILIKGAEGVSQSYDYLEALFNDIKAILLRLQVHTHNNVPGELRQIYETFLKRTMKPDDSKAADLKDRLSILVGQETAMVGALNLGVTMDVRTILSRETRTLSGLNHQISDIKLALQAISLKDGGRGPEEDLMAIRKALDPETSVETDLAMIQCLKGTGEWLFSEQLIEDWLAGNIPVLRLSGGPGAGKSHLSSLMIKHLHSRQTDSRITSPCNVGYFFCKMNDPKRMDFLRILKTAAFQYATQDSTYRRYLKTACEDTNRLQTLEGVWHHLYLAFFTPEVNTRTYMVLDGLDEAQRNQLSNFLELLYQATSAEETQSSLNISFLLVGRPEIDWYAEEISGNTYPLIDVQTLKNQRDIRKFIVHEIEKNRNLRKVSKKLRNEIIDKLSEGANGMFLWADLMIKEISRKNRESAIQKALGNLPKGLPEMYTRMFQKHATEFADEPEQIDDLKQLVMWVGFAKYPLNLVELEVALQMRSDEPGGEVIDLLGELKRKYASFFTIITPDREEIWGDVLPVEADSDQSFSNNLNHNSDDDTDSESMDTPIADITILDKILSKVQLRHASLGDFLNFQSENMSSIGISVAEAHLQLLKTCLRSMVHPEFRPPNFMLAEATVVMERPSARMTQNIYYYARKNWLHHLVETPKEISVKDRADIIQSIYKYLTDSKIIIDRLANYDFKKYDFMEPNSDMISAIQPWLSDQEALQLCSAEVQIFALKAAEDQKELIKPTILVICKDLVTHQHQEPAWDAIEPLRSYFLRYHYEEVGRKLYNASDADESFGPMEELKEILAYFGFKEDTLWHANIAQMYNYGGRYRAHANSTKAIDHYNKALSLCEDNPKLRVVFLLRLRSVYRRLNEQDKRCEALADEILTIIKTEDIVLQAPNFTVYPFSEGSWYPDKEMEYFMDEVANEKRLQGADSENSTFQRFLDILNKESWNHQRILDLLEALRPEDHSTAADFMLKILRNQRSKTMPCSLLVEFLIFVAQRRRGEVTLIQRIFSTSNEWKIQQETIVQEAVIILKRYKPTDRCADTILVLDQIYPLQDDLMIIVNYCERAIEQNLINSKCWEGGRGLSRPDAIEHTWNHLYEDWHAIFLTHVYARCISGTISLDYSNQDILRKIQSLDEYRSQTEIRWGRIFKSTDLTANRITASMLASLHRDNGDDKSADEYVMRLLRRVFRNGIWRRYVDWTLLAWVAHFLDDEESMKWALWFRSDQIVKQALELRTNSAARFDSNLDEVWINQHGRAWPNHLSSSPYFCGNCFYTNSMLPPYSTISHWGPFIPISTWDSAGPICDTCFQKAKTYGSSCFDYNNSRQKFRRLDINEFPLRQPEGVTDEDEKQMVIEAFRAKLRAFDGKLEDDTES